MKPAERQRFLDQRHAAYHDYGQKVNSHDARFVELGHPLANDFLLLRAEFDRLKYACNSGERYIAFKDETEYAELKAPGLTLSWRPTGLPEDVWFGHIYPAHDRWMEYMEYAASAGWPEGVGPKMDDAGAYVHTKNAVLVGKIFGLVNGKADIQKKEGGFIVRARFENAKQGLAVLKAIRTAMRRWVLPERTPADDVWDAAEVDLANKKFTLAGVEKVTTDATRVLVPLIPMDASGQVLAEQVANDLLDLCRQGYRYDACRDWLAKFLNSQAMRKFDKEFGYKKAA